MNHDSFKDDFDEEYTLSLGQFARLCGTTRDTLRYYYEEGIITPRVDPFNGYHYYSASQISSFFFITTMRQAGCSIKEISDLIHNSNRESIEKIVNSKILKMQKELFLINQKISALHLGMWILGKFQEHKPGIPFMDEMPEISYSETKVTNKETAHHTADIAGDISIHLTNAAPKANLSTFPAGVTISYQDLIKKKYVYNSIISLSFLPADNIDSFPLPGITAVCCYHESSSSSIDSVYKKIVSFIKKNNLKVCSDLFVISLINLYDKGRDHTYFKYLFICVE
jgi:DNA-binding transcriptional MerR regulator